MRSLVFYILLFSVFSRVSFAQGSETVNILFIGNSFTFRHDLPELVEKVIEEGHPELNVNVDRVVYGGQNMFKHSTYYMSHTFIEQSSISDDSINARINTMEGFLQLTENPEEYQHFMEALTTLDWVWPKTPGPISDIFGNIENAISNHQKLLDNNPRKKWDFVVLQSWQDVHESLSEGYAYGVKKFIPTIEEQGAKVILYHTAPNVQNSEPVTEPKYQERVDYELSAVRNLAESIDVFSVVPVPQAVNMIQQGGSDYTFCYVNDFHPNQRAAFLTANMFYTAFFNESTVGFSFNSVTETKLDENGKDPDGGDATVVFPTAEKEYLQLMAYNAVTEFNQSWKDGKNIPVSGVVLGDCSVSQVGDTCQLTAIVAPIIADDKTVTWSSNDPSVASVNSSGLVIVHSEGTATITVTTNDGGYTATSNISIVVEPVQSPYGGSNRTIPGLIEAEHYDEGGQDVSYNDDDSKQGDATFRPEDMVDVAIASNFSGGYNVGYTLSGEWLEYTVDVTSGTYDVVFYYSSGASPTGDLKVSLDDTELTTISGLESKGWNTPDSITVRGIAIAGGTDKILRLEVVNGRKFNIDAIKFIASGTIATPVEGVSIGACPASDMVEGDTQQLTATVSPVNATDADVSWSSSNETVATVDANGLVTAVSAGSTDITVKTADGDFAETCAIYVVAPIIDVIGVTISACPTEDIERDSILQLSAIITPEDATDTSVSWSSSDETVARVDASGIVTTLGIGNTDITVRTSDGEYTDICTINVVTPSAVSKIDQVRSGFEMYPNPVSDQLTIKFSQADKDRVLKIFDAYGRLLHQATAQGLELKLDLKEIKTKGILLVQVICGNKIGSENVIVE